MTASPLPRLMTAEELMELPDEPGERYELVRGELRVSPFASALAGVTAARLVGRLGGWIETHCTGLSGTAGSAFRLACDPDTVRAPSLWFVRAERVPAEGIPETFWPGTPDLAVEVLSPSDRFVDVLEKAQDYLAAGTLMVWAIDPRGRSAAIFRQGQSPRLLGEDSVLDGEEVVPGFSVPLRDILP